MIKTIYHTAIKTFRHGLTNPELPTVLLAAPTGVSAININGTTVNTALSIPKEVGDILPAMSDQKRTQLRLSLSQLKLIIIDEISMVSNTTLLHIHQRLKEIFGTPNSKLFAKISILAVGDLYQHPPIRRKPVFEDYKNDAFNLSHPWNLFKMIEFTEIMRQKNDQKFTQLFNRIRTASQTEADIACIKSRSILPSDNNYPNNALHIWAENKPVDEYNMTKLNQISTQEFILTAIDQYPQNVNQQDINKVLSRTRSETGGLDSKIIIKERARVMLTTNIDIADRLINGQMGTVIKVDVNQNTKKIIIYVKFDDNEAGKNAINKCPNPRQNQVVPIEPVLRRIKIRPGKPSSPEIQRIQFPMTLAWACTVHKVQGLTLQYVVHLNRQRSFNHGQIYVALSRCTSLQGLYTLGQIEGKHIKANPNVRAEYERLRELSLSPNTMSTNVNHITISLLNVRSLRKHSIDIRYDQNILHSDIVALTETQLLPGDTDNDIRNDLNPFLLHRQDNASDKYSSLAVAIHQTIQIEEQQHFPTINGLKCTGLKNTTQQTLTMLLLYRKQSCNISQYISSIEYILNTYDIELVLGDFNINYFNDNDISSLSSLFTALHYNQIVEQPTFISSGSLLDHIYVNQSKLDIVNSSVISVYYSKRSLL